MEYILNAIGNNTFVGSYYFSVKTTTTTIMFIGDSVRNQQKTPFQDLTDTQTMTGSSIY